jgi:hypothetical protein
MPASMHRCSRVFIESSLAIVVTQFINPGDGSITEGGAVA